MRSRLPKVLHPIGGRPLIRHVLAAVAETASAVAAVVAPVHAAVEAEVGKADSRAAVFVQAERRGTAHAVLAARAAITGGADVVVVFGDTPLITAGTLIRLRGALTE